MVDYVTDLELDGRLYYNTVLKFSHQWENIWAYDYALCQNQLSWSERRGQKYVELYSFGNHIQKKSLKNFCFY
jgi:hypothetical protein